MKLFKKVSFKRIVMPFTGEKTENVGEGFYYNSQQYVHYSGLEHSETAFFRLSGLQIVIVLLLIVICGLGLLSSFLFTLQLLVGLAVVFYFTDLLYNLYLILKSFANNFELNQGSNLYLLRSNWPMYTILCPLYKEWSVLPQFIKAMTSLEYPKDKLQVMLLLESDDIQTIEKVRKTQLPSYFEVVVVPDSKPKTKPKACNYGLKHAKGEYIVIYDAEDIPDVQQLKKAVQMFDSSASDVACVQAMLNFYNPHQNLLTRAFTAEYSLWFDLVLTGLQVTRSPIPLGGTSNHFRKEKLIEIKGWDSFNVTEDADLGIRLAKQGYRTEMIDSITLEEANSSVPNWFWQRTRWIKGYMQTYLVHMRNPFEFSKSLKRPHILTFQLVIGGKILSLFINPLMWLLTICYFAFRSTTGQGIEALFPGPIFYLGVVSLVFGNFLYMYYYMIGCTKHGHFDLVKYAFLIPLYWLGMSVAAYVALYKLITAPHHWSKTKHGLHLQTTSTLANLLNRKGAWYTNNLLL